MLPCLLINYRLFPAHVPAQTHGQAIVMYLFETTAIDTPNSSRLPTTSRSFPPEPIIRNTSVYHTVARVQRMSTWVITSADRTCFFPVEPPGIVCFRRSGGSGATGPVYCAARRSLATDLRLESMFPRQFLMVSLANTPNPKCKQIGENGYPSSRQEFLLHDPSQNGTLLCRGTQRAALLADRYIPRLRTNKIIEALNATDGRLFNNVFCGTVNACFSV